MDKQRHPNVVRTWTVERTKVPTHHTPAKLRSRSQKDLFPGAKEQSDPPFLATKGGPIDAAPIGMVHR